MPPFTYVAEPSKNGYHLLVEPAFALEKGKHGASNFRQQIGSGYFWPLLAATKYGPREFRHPREFSGLIQLVNSDSEYVIYSRDPTGLPCRPK